MTYSFYKLEKKYLFLPNKTYIQSRMAFATDLRRTGRQRRWIKRRLFCRWQIKVVNGVILISWNQNVLERQIDYGAKLGHVVLSLARMELNNFYKNVTPVSDFYDQKGMLISVGGFGEKPKQNLIYYVSGSIIQLFDQFDAV